VSVNSLLLWMSARVRGSWQQFRSAVEELHMSGDGTAADRDEAKESGDQYALSVYQTLRLNLQRLGHAEFFAGAGDAEWRVAPPSIAITRQPWGWRGVIAGARSPAFLGRLLSASRLCALDTLTAPACPDPLRLSAGDPSQLQAVAQQAGLLVQADAPLAILQSLPVIDDPAVRSPCTLPFGADWRIDRFSAVDLSWRSVSRQEAESASGLFRWTFGHQRLFILRRKGTPWAMPGQVGKYLLLRWARKRVLRYDSSGMALSAPASCRPPFLVETGCLQYHDVPAAIAQLAAGILRQEPL